jgi:hypothetical protein
MAKRIDSLVPGQKAQLKLVGSKSLGNSESVVDVEFVRIDGQGETREAVFTDFSIYRFQGRWAYGTSAERAQLV